MSNKKQSIEDARQQEEIQAGTRAEALLDNKNWAIMETYISYNLSIISELLTGGLRPDIDNGIIVKTAEQKNWEYVGKVKVLKDIERHLNSLVTKKNKLLDKKEV